MYMYTVCIFLLFSLFYICTYACAVHVHVHVPLLYFSDDDLKLNSQTFNWPEKMDPIFEVSQRRLLSRREKAEADLKEKVVKFEEQLTEYHNTIELYKDKEVMLKSLHMHISDIILLFIYRFLVMLMTLDLLLSS